MNKSEGMSDLVFELRAERERLTRHIESWRERIIALLDAYEATLSEEALDDAFRRAFVKCRRDLVRAVQPLGLDVIEPNPGDPFDERLHRVVRESTDPRADQARILELRRSGYRSGSEVLRHAEVVTGYIADKNDQHDIIKKPPRPGCTDLFERLQSAAAQNASGVGMTDNERRRA